MAYCPNCGFGLPVDAASCTDCGANFGSTSSWRPVEDKPLRKANPRQLSKGILVVIALVAIVVFGYRFVQDKNRRIPIIGQGGVSVREVAGCNDALSWDKNSQVQKVARDGETVVVQLLANEACGPLRAVQPHAEVVGNNVTLGWSWELPKGAPVAACKCTRHFEFRIPGIPPGDHNVTVAEPGWTN